MTQLLTYNAFGLITVTHDAVRVSTTAIAGKRAVSRTVEVNCSLKHIEPGEIIHSSFGAWIAPDAETRFTFHEHGKLKSGEVSTEFAEVTTALSQSIKLVKESIFRD
jgi:hypothetical protein